MTDPRRYPKWLILGLYAVAMIAVYFVAQAWQQRHLAVGPAPPLVARTISGDPVALPVTGHGPVLLHFWATWCPVCRLEQDVISALAQDWPVLTVAYDTADVVAAYMQENELDFPVVADARGEIAARYGVTGVPVSFIIDASGMIRFRERGFSTGPGLRARLWWARQRGSRLQLSMR